MLLRLCSLVPLYFRYENTGDSASWYSAYVRQRPPAVLFCVLYIRHCWGAAVGWTSSESVFHASWRESVSTVLLLSNRQPSSPLLLFYPLSAESMSALSTWSKVAANCCQQQWHFSHWQSCKLSIAPWCQISAEHWSPSTEGTHTSNKGTRVKQHYIRKVFRGIDEYRLQSSKWIEL